MCCKSLGGDSLDGGEEAEDVETEAAATQGELPPSEQTEDVPMETATTQAAVAETEAATPTAVATPEPTPQPVSQPETVTVSYDEPVDFNTASEEYKFAEAYNPTWFDRSTGWDGQSYLAAGTFCASRNLMLCPYEAYCPTGPNHLPYGGVRPDAGSWAPISDSNNGWVSVSEDNACVRYMVLNLISPHWGLTGEGNEEITRHLMCCRDPNRAVTSDREDMASYVSDGSDDAAGAAAAMFYSDESDPVPEEEAMEKVYSFMSANFEPIAYTRDNGWDGQTYGDALRFCASQNSKIPCPYEVLCPMASNGYSIVGMWTFCREIFIEICAVSCSSSVTC